MITVTEEALSQLRSLVDDVDGDVAGIRFGVKGGGCAGFEYLFGFADEEPGDAVVELGAIRVFIDPASQPFVRGAEIGWSSTLGSYGFKISNPNASGGCGCGKSFDVEAASPGDAAKEGCGGCG